MDQTAAQWIKVTYKKTVTSIAFLPAIIAILFLLLSFVMISFDFSDAGKNIKANLNCAAFLEPIFYHPIVVFFSIKGNFHFFSGKKLIWGNMPREGFRNFTRKMRTDWSKLNTKRKRKEKLNKY